jgi:glycine/D-amino acid oxidase-like deaminating enzyme
MVLDVDVEDGAYAVPPVAGTGLKIGDHRVDGPAGHPAEAREAAEAEARAVFDAARRRLADPDGYRIVGARTCYYTMTDDERFLVERDGDAVVVSACSGHGFKFGPLVGERVAAALEAGEDGAALASWARGEGP